MTYRGVVRHVRYWRGTVHRWSTVYHFAGTPSSGLTAADALLLLNADNKMLFGTGGNVGGTYECALYNQASGGVPIAVQTQFDWTSPATWQSGSATVWTGTLGALDGAAETAALVEWPAGLSSTGKPVRLRKWYHMVPVTPTGGQGVQISAANVAALQAQGAVLINALGGKGLVMSSASGRLAGSSVLVPSYYSNHQMPRGRRKRTAASAQTAEANYGKIIGIINGEAQAS